MKPSLPSHSTSDNILPWMMIDTSSLYALADWLHSADQYPAPGGARAKSLPEFGDIMQAILGNTRQLVMTRHQFAEMFPTVVGRLDMERRDDGTIGIPEGVGHRELTGHCEHNLGAVYQWFQQCQQQGKLRFYESTQALFDAGEVEYPRGGIVIVDTSRHPQPIGEQGRTFSDYKNRQAGGTKIDPAQGNADAGHPFPTDHFKPKRDLGDKASRRLLSRLLKYTKEHELPSKCMLISEDREMLDLFHEQIDKHFGRNVSAGDPLVQRMLQTVWAMQLRDALPDGTAEALTDAYQRQQHARNWHTSLEESATSRERFGHDVGRVATWLGASNAVHNSKPALGRHTAALAAKPETACTLGK